MAKRVKNAQQEDELEIAGVKIEPGECKVVDLIAPNLYTHVPVPIPIHVIRGKKAGPRLFVMAAIHGDEINGVEIIRRLLKIKSLADIRGTLIAVSVANIYGFVALSRYLPDRRDLNRAFPGSKKGSLAARLAYLYMNEVVLKCTHGIDLHTGSIHRSNLPQIRYNLNVAEAEHLARAFAAPVIMGANVRDGSLRQACSERGIPLLVYEAGEALRFHENSIRKGVKGILNVMVELGMLKKPLLSKKVTSKNVKPIPICAHSSTWIRAPQSGIVQYCVKLGEKIKKGESLGEIVDPFDEIEKSIISPLSGVLVGKNNLPLVNEGDALFHVASVKKINPAAKKINTILSQEMGVAELLMD